jgi:hypothetical protein
MHYLLRAMLVGTLIGGLVFFALGAALSGPYVGLALSVFGAIIGFAVGFTYGFDQRAGAPHMPACWRAGLQKEPSRLPGEPAMSSVALEYLRRCEWRPAIRDRAAIVAALEREGLPVFEPVVCFQQRYGGLVQYAILEPIYFGLIHHRPRGSIDPDTIVANEDEGAWYFQCADTRYQMDFELDQDGTYFEAGAHASSFDKFIEDAAQLNKLASDKSWVRLSEDETLRLDSPDMPTRLGLTRIEAASDCYTTWWRSDETILRVRGDSVQQWRKRK